MKQERLELLEDIFSEGMYRVNVKTGEVKSLVTNRQINVRKVNGIKKVTLYSRLNRKAYDFYLGEVIAVKIGMFAGLGKADRYRVQYNDRENVNIKTIEVRLRRELESEGGIYGFLISRIRKGAAMPHFRINIEKGSEWNGTPFKSRN